MSGSGMCPQSDGLCEAPGPRARLLNGRVGQKGAEEGMAPY